MAKNKKIIIKDMYGQPLEIRDSLNAEQAGMVILALETNEMISLSIESAVELREILDRFIEYGTTRTLKNM